MYNIFLTPMFNNNERNSLERWIDRCFDNLLKFV